MAFSLDVPAAAGSPASGRSRRQARATITGNSLAELRQVVEEYSGNPELRQAFEDFRLMRERLRKPMTGRAVRNICRELETLAPGDDTHKIAILDQSITSAWQGVFPLRHATAKPAHAMAPCSGTDICTATGSAGGDLPALSGGTGTASRSVTPGVPFPPAFSGGQNSAPGAAVPPSSYATPVKSFYERANENAWLEFDRQRKAGIV